MDIMKKLGFQKRGADKGKEGFRFSDRYARKEGETRIFNLIVLDESGSMGSIRQAAFTGANETIQAIRTAQTEHPDDHQMLSFVTFDSGGSRPDVRILIDNERIEDVRDIRPEQYNPSGCTPLFDAMGLSINALRDLVKDGDHVLVTVITDGFENSSRQFSGAMIKELVDGLTAQGWSFTYIGANQDSEQAAGGLGIRNAMDFEATSAGARMMWGKVHSSRREFYKKVRLQKEGAAVDLNEDLFGEKGIANRVTPDWITDLAPNQVFVFGSNEYGRHDGGAARIALERFGAVYGQGRGLQGRSYAIPTMSGNLEAIAREVKEFISFADSNPDLTFLVTRIGCGIAGWSDMDIAPLFADAYSLPNVCLPREFWDILTFKFKR